MRLQLCLLLFGLCVCKLEAQVPRARVIIEINYKSLPDFVKKTKVTFIDSVDLYEFTRDSAVGKVCIAGKYRNEHRVVVEKLSNSFIQADLGFGRGMFILTIQQGREKMKLQLNVGFNEQLFLVQQFHFKPGCFSVDPGNRKKEQLMNNFEYITLDDEVLVNLLPTMTNVQHKL